MEGLLAYVMNQLLYLMLISGHSGLTKSLCDLLYAILLSYRSQDEPGRHNKLAVVSGKN